MSVTLRVLGLFSLLLVGTGCAKTVAPISRIGPPVASLPALVRSPVVVLSDLQQQDAWQAFEDNVFVGDIWLSGGYEYHVEHDNQVRSVEVDLRDEIATREVIESWLPGVIDGALAKGGVAYTAPGVSIEAALVAPKRSLVRGSGAIDGEDNQNLPRFTLEPQALDPAALPVLAGSAAAILVPMVVHYYSHSGGWFIGQNDGCEAGARIRILWALHDRATGQVLTWGEVGDRHVQERVFAPSKAQREDYLLQVEARVAGLLELQLIGPSETK